MRRSMVVAYYQAGDMRARISMEVEDPQDVGRRRELTLLRSNDGTSGDQRYQIFFHFPEDVRGSAVSVRKRKGKGKADDLWRFDPVRGEVERAPPIGARSPFLESEFRYEELTGPDPDLEYHTLLRSNASVSGRSCYLVESRRKIEADYFKRVTCVDEENWLPLRQDFYDSFGQKTRVLELDGLVRLDGGRWWATRWSVRDVRTGRSTVLRYEDVEFGVGLPESVFGERYLQRPPRRWMRFEGN